LQRVVHLERRERLPGVVVLRVHWGTVDAGTKLVLLFLFLQFGCFLLVLLLYKLQLMKFLLIFLVLLALLKNLEFLEFFYQVRIDA
jgi:hypothetical protein